MTYNKDYYLKNRVRILEKYHERKRKERLSSGCCVLPMKPSVVIDHKPVVVRFD